MDSEVLTLGALALALVGAWVVDLLSHRGASSLERQMTKQLKKSADTISGKL